MDVRMGNLQSQHDDRHPFAVDLPFDPAGDFLGEEHHAGEHLIVQIENVIDLFLGHDERMSFGQGVDVEKCVVIRIFGDFVRRNLSGDDA